MHPFVAIRYTEPNSSEEFAPVINHPLVHRSRQYIHYLFHHYSAGHDYLFEFCFWLSLIITRGILTFLVSDFVFFFPIFLSPVFYPFLQLFVSSLRSFFCFSLAFLLFSYSLNLRFSSAPPSFSSLWFLLPLLFFLH